LYFFFACQEGIGVIFRLAFEPFTALAWRPDFQGLSSQETERTGFAVIPIRLPDDISSIVRRVELP
jgi:hypothetical protein